MGEKTRGCTMGAKCMASRNITRKKYNTQERSHNGVSHGIRFTEFLSYYSFPWEVLGT